MPQKISAKMPPHSFKADISTWSLQAVDDFNGELQKCILAGVTEVINYALKENVLAWFPNEWNFGESPDDGINGPPPEDPMTIYLTLPLGAYEGEGPTWGFSLSELVDLVIDGHKEPKAGKIYLHDGTKCVAEIRDGLRALAQKIDDAIADET